MKNYCERSNFSNISCTSELSFLVSLAEGNSGCCGCV